MKTKWYLLGCATSLLLVILFIVLTISSIVSMSKRASSVQRIEANSVLHLNLTGPMQAYTALADENFRWVPGSLHDVLQKIQYAKTDNRINAIVLEPSALQAGYAGINELHYALADFKTSGKKVFGYITSATQADILLLGIADEVYMNPSASAGFFLHGIGGSQVFFKDMLDKLGVTMNVVKAGDYKSAGEPFTRTSMSPEFSANLTAIYDDLYAQLLKDLARQYDSTELAFRYIIETRDDIFINQELAKEIKIVDELMFRDAFLKKIGVNDKQLVSHSKYKVPPSVASITAKNKIAVVYMLGNITSERAQFGQNNITSSQYVKIFDKIMDDDTIKAVVLRIDSGGGSALESEIIYNKIEQLREKKPVITSMGGMAASGGYYIATNSNYIVADPYTITGSIGVFGMIPDLSGTAKKVGISTQQLGHGKFLSAFDPFSPMDRAYERALQRHIISVYDEFKNRVATSRNLSLEAVEKIAQGQIWSAPKALEHKLIDEVGTLNDAIAKAVQMSSTPNHTLVYFPERRTFFEQFMEDNFNFSLARMALGSIFPSFARNHADEVIDLINEVKNDPIQMRSEVYFGVWE